ncbi:MAG: peptidoglycan editing factor PgeF [Chloroflexi bacterium]|nr:peptidoglycan editing factor PgeF [Chloroflexota bacterium]
MIRKTSSDLIYYRFASLAACGGLVHAVSTRLGGVSTGHLATLNLSYSVGDDPAAVVENRQRLSAALGLALDDWVAASQVHGSRVALVGAAERGRGAYQQASTLPETDALITAQPGLLLTLRLADCAPIFFFDPAHHAVGLAHAGWRGTVANIAAITVQAMATAFGSRPGDLRAVIGPAIGPCCYAIGGDVASQVQAALPWATAVLAKRPGGSLYLDLWEANRQALLAAGLRPEHIEVATLCSACHTAEFYSHRAERGHTGRFGALIGLR